MRVSDDLDHEQILAVAAPYLERCLSVQTEWRPGAVRRSCSCRKLHPCSSRCMRVLVEDSSESVSSAYVQVDDPFRIRDRIWDGTQWGRLGQGLVGAVLVVEPFVLAQGVAQVTFIPQ